MLFGSKLWSLKMVAIIGCSVLPKDSYILVRTTASRTSASQITH